MLRKLKLTLGAAAIALTAGTAQAQEFVRIGGGLAGTYPLFAAKLSELINDTVGGYRAAVVPSDSEQAQAMLQLGELDLNIAYTWLVKKIADGNGAYGMAAPDARHIITLYGSALHMVALPDSIDSLYELNREPVRVWTGPESQFFYQIIAPVVQSHGLEMSDITAAGGVTETMDYGGELQAFQDGRLDVGFFSGGVPYGMLQQIERSPGFKLLGLNDAAWANLQDIVPGMGAMTIPAGTYLNQEADVLTPYYVNQLVASVNTPDDLIYEVTKIMMEQYEAFHGLFPGAEEIDNVDPLIFNQVPLHPGAERYYREIGMIE